MDEILDLYDNDFNKLNKTIRRKIDEILKNWKNMLGVSWISVWRLRPGELLSFGA